MADNTHKAAETDLGSAGAPAIEIEVSEAMARAGGDLISAALRDIRDGWVGSDEMARQVFAAMLARLEECKPFRADDVIRWGPSDDQLLRGLYDWDPFDTKPDGAKKCMADSVKGLGQAGRDRESLKQELTRRIIAWEDSSQLASEFADDILDLLFGHEAEGGQFED